MFAVDAVRAPVRGGITVDFESATTGLAKGDVDCGSRFSAVVIAAFRVGLDVALKPAGA